MPSQQYYVIATHTHTHPTHTHTVTPHQKLMGHHDKEEGMSDQLLLNGRPDSLISVYSRLRTKIVYVNDFDVTIVYLLCVTRANEYIATVFILHNSGVLLYCLEQ